jgi:sulfatase-like protein
LSAPQKKFADHPGSLPLPHPVKEKIRDVIVALSLANLCFIGSWFNSLYDKDSYYNKFPILLPTLLALLVNIFWVFCVVWLGLRVRRRFQNRALHFVLHLAFLAMLLIPLDFFRLWILHIWDYQLIAWFKQPVVMLCALTLLALIICLHRWAVKIAGVIVAVLAPMAVVSIGKTILLCLGVMHLQQQVSAPVLPPTIPVAEGRPRVVWIIFDASDYRLIYEQRPPGVALPEYDRLRSESLSAVNAVSPDNNTINSMPSLISGQRVANAAIAGISDLNVRLADTGADTSWKKLPSVFAQARGLGFNTALVGWFHPYDRVLGNGLNYCMWYPFPQYEPDRSPTFGGSMRRQIGNIVSTLHIRKIFISICQGTLHQSLLLVTNSTYGLILLHLPPPHTPGVYLPDTDTYTYWPTTRVGGYFRNLALADHELGQIRRAMESSGEWDKTWIIVSADHSWQQSPEYDGKLDYRVPFVIKPPGANQSMAYTPQFNTILTHDLILAILRGEVTNQQNLAGWLDTNGRPIPTITAKIDN